MGGTMKRIKLEPLPQTIMGRPFTIANFREPMQATPYKCHVCGSEGMTEQPGTIKDAGLVDLLEMLIVSTPRDRISMQDAINANAFIQQAGNSENGYLQLDDGIYDWIKKQVYDFAPKVYGVNAFALKQAIENLEEPATKGK